MDDLLRVGYSVAEAETVNITAGRFAELIRMKAIYDMFEAAAESSESNYENFKAISVIFPCVCIEGSTEGAQGRIAIPEKKYSQLVCTEQNLYELYRMLDKENYYIIVGKLIKFFNLKREAQGEAELVTAAERDEFGGLIPKTGKVEGGEDNAESA